MQIDKSKKYTDNPRQITGKAFDLLKKHLETLGDLSGVVYCTVNGQYLGGNMRSEIMDGAGIEIIERFEEPTKQKTLAYGFIHWNGEKFAYREVAFSKKEFKQACIVANSNGGVWDWDTLANGAWQDEPLTEWGLELPTDWAGKSDFHPNLNPTQAARKVSAEDIVKTKHDLETKYQGQKDEFQEVICPHCAETFFIK